MKSRLLKSALIAASALAPLSGIPAGPAEAQSVAAPAQQIVISIGRGQLVTVPGSMSDIFVANDSIADVQVKSQRQLYVFGKAGGETTVYASNSAGDIVWSANVRVGSNLDSVDQMLTLAMPEAKINVATMGTNTVLLTGTVAAPEDAAEAERLVSAFVGDNANVISRLKTATPLQVNLRVRFAEVSRSLVRSLGVNLASIDSSSGFQFGIGQGRAGWLPSYRPGGGVTGVGAGSVTTVCASITDPTKLAECAATSVSPLANGTTIGAFGKFLGLDIGSALDLAERDGLVTTLSQPNLTALSGETAEFLAGGEFPIPLSQGLGTTTVEYKKYGVSLAYTPTVLANGRISIRVRPEVSELSSQGAVTLNGFQIPALTIRRAETTVELGSGQSFMIAGLLSNNAQNTIDKAPGVGDLPILGNLFKSTEFRKGQTELVIVVTPYLVNPVDDSEIKLPTDGFRAPDAGQQFLLNRENNGVTGAERPGPEAAGESAPPPAVGLGDNVTAPRQADDADRRKDMKTEKRAEAASPGFSFQ
ncbi:type II and III secretion system protein family protein [Croceibacterium aestuarii]|uniref:type II and III secretion system protein family protein n=1 Tax=Croceibacterium aestuarii TaxID=3064139 RepID=UPI00272DD05D|nr:type II and III secretion system protein family protein [Croceibacterium sp. D39]